MDKPAIETLFSKYIGIVNRAIAQNRDRVPYKQLFAGGEKLLGEHRVGVVVYDKAGSNMQFTIALDNARFTIVDREEEQGSTADTLIEWKVSVEHLEHVVANPQPYIESPIKLDLDWLETRIRHRDKGQGEAS